MPCLRETLESLQLETNGSSKTWNCWSKLLLLPSGWLLNFIRTISCPQMTTKTIPSCTCVSWTTRRTSWSLMKQTPSGGMRFCQMYPLFSPWDMFLMRDLTDTSLWCWIEGTCPSESSKWTKSVSEVSGPDNNKNWSTFETETLREDPFKMQSKPWETSSTLLVINPLVTQSMSLPWQLLSQKQANNWLESLAVHLVLIFLKSQP